MDVLTASTKKSSFAIARLLAQMSEGNNTRMKTETRPIEAKYDKQVNNAETKVDQWKKVSKDIGKATTAISSNIGKLKSIQSKLDSLLSAVNKADQGASASDFNSDGYATSFDALLKSISGDTQDSGRKINLIGKRDVSLEYKIDIYGRTESVSSVSLDGDYHIIDSNGDRWGLDRQAGNLKRYTDYPNGGTSDVGGFRSGIRLDSIDDSNNISFTIAPDTASPQAFSGTLHRSGLDIMDSWYYENLSTATARDAASSDIHSARTAIKLEIARYESAFSLAQFYEERADGEMRGHREDKNEALLEKAREVGKAREKLQRQFQAARSAMQMSMDMKQEYANFLMPTAGSWGRKLVDILS